jgi:uncharacterized membrane protein
MSTLVILARLLHISSGVFWGGAILFMNFVVGPSIAALGPDGAKVMQELVRRRYLELFIWAGTLTVLSGLYLVWVDSAGFSGDWFGTRFGQGISTGMLAALIAYVMGVFIIRPAVYRMLALAGQMAQAPANDRPAIMEQMNAARNRLMSMGITATVFLVIAIFSMAVARYL